jgi:hypothetical protein
VELGSCHGEAVEGEVSLLVEEFLVRGKEAFRSMDESSLGCVCDRRLHCLQKVDMGKGLAFGQGVG